MQSSLAFLRPTSCFYSYESEETLIRLSISSHDSFDCDISSIQGAIDEVSSTLQDKSILVLKISGVYIVKDEPLRVNSNTQVILENLILKCDKDSKAKSLILLSSVEYVSITSSDASIIDGSLLSIVGIEFFDTRHCHITGVQIRHCLGGGIVCSGGGDGSCGDGELHEMNSISMCIFNDCNIAVLIAGTNAFILMSNEISSSLIGLSLQTSIRSVIVSCVFTENTTDIQCGSANCVILSNIFSGGSDCNMFFLAESSGNIICDNRFALPFCRFSHTIRFSGTCNLFYCNNFSDEANIGFDDSGISASNVFMSQRNLLSYNIQPSVNSDEVALASTIFSTNCGFPTTDKMQLYHPVTSVNQHDGEISVTENRALSIRINVTVRGSMDETCPSDVIAIDEEIKSKQSQFLSSDGNLILVVTVEGHFVSRNPNGLLVPSNTCVILKGSITALPLETVGVELSESTKPSQLVLLSQGGLVSFSGGTLNCNGQVDHGIFVAGPSLRSNSGSSLVESVTIIRAAKDGINTKGKVKKFPLVIHGCHIVESGGRAVWLHVASNVHLIKNICEKSRYDGIDFDAYSSNCTAIYNTCSENSRYYKLHLYYPVWNKTDSHCEFFILFLCHFFSIRV